MKRRLYTQFVAVLSSKKFFYVLMTLFIIETVWIALTGRYPMAFDEDVHLGIIKLYAHQISPYFTRQPVGPAPFGAIVHDPSYVYHWLMSFPYRFSNALFHNEVVSSIILRLCSICFVALGIGIFRKLLVEMKASKALVNTVIMFFILTPLVPFEAAQITYDNLLFPLIALSLLLTIHVVRDVMRGTFNTLRLMVLLAICMISSLVMSSFLPVFLAILGVVGVALFRAWRLYGTKHVRAHAAAHFLSLHRGAQALTIAFFVVTTGMFVWTYGFNTIRYGTPTPACNQVITIDQCRSYGAWERSDDYSMHKMHVDPNPLAFSWHWGASYLYSFVSVVNGAYSGFTLGPALPVLWIGTIVFFWISAVVLIWQWRNVFSDPTTKILGVITAIYMLIVWVQNYTDYLHLDQAATLQGRYLLGFLMLLFMFVGKAFSFACIPWPIIRVTLVIVLVLVCTQGGGPITFFVDSGPAWWWEHSRITTKVNNAAQHILRPLMISRIVIDE